MLGLLFHLIGIGSASGLFYKDNSVFLVSDSGKYLYQYHIGSKMLEKDQILAGDTLENISKKSKPDFEAIAAHGDTLFVFGSGSAANRNTMIAVNQLTKKVISATDLSYLYLTMQSFGNIKAEDFNIEGVVYDGETWYFLQRGNGKSGKNGIFTVGGKNLESDFSMLYNEIKLPKINGVRSSFTDAAMADGKLYFLASAEDAKSTYEDGMVFGSLVGTIDLNKMKLISTKKISDTHKFEGIALYEKTDKEITFLLCEDNDTETLESDIYKLVLEKK